MNELTIISELKKWFVTADYKLTNVFIFDWESDFFCITKSGYTMEVEVKISRSDFKADAQKTQKHFILRNAEKELVTMPGWAFEEYCNISIIKPVAPNKFYYCCPEGMIKSEEVPEYAGLLYLKETSNEDYNNDKWIDRIVSQVKPAKWLHKNRPDLSKILLSKYYYKYQELSVEYNMLLYYLRKLQERYNPDGELEHNKKFEEQPKFYEQTLFNF